MNRMNMLTLSWDLSPCPSRHPEADVVAIEGQSLGHSLGNSSVFFQKITAYFTHIVTNL